MQHAALRTLGFCNALEQIADSRSEDTGMLLHSNRLPQRAWLRKAKSLWEGSRPMQDTGQALGSDLMTASLEGYAFLKVAGKGKGLDDLKKMLSVRFLRRSSATPPDDPTASQ